MSNENNELKRRSVAFNTADPIQRKLFKHTFKYTNFSAYIKTLIQRDLAEYVDEDADSCSDKSAN
jgi:uncharacterized protein Yka (UPF0111/DUF47 family)